MRRSSLALAMLGALALPGLAQAQTTADFQVRVEVVDACEISTADGATLDFGTYDFLDSLVPATVSVSVRCTLLTPYAIGLDQGLHGSATNDRKMKHETEDEYLDYSLTCAGLTGFDCLTQWGNVDGERYEGIGLGLVPEVILVTGTIAGSQNAAAGVYTDTVTATVTALD